MCLIALALGMHAEFPLVIAANRDEFFDRPTAALSEWTSQQGQPIVGGRDLRSGGTWMAVTRRGRIAMLTNVREPGDKRIYAQSRGELVLRWLESDLPVSQWLEQTQSIDFAGFNLLVCAQHGGPWHWISNRTVLPEHRVSPAWPWRCDTLSRTGVYTLSNAGLSTPWPKSEQLAHILRGTMEAAHSGAAGVAEIKAALWKALENSAPAPADQVPNTGVTPALEAALSSVFVDLRDQAKAYGTRSSTLIIGTPTNTAFSAELGIEIAERTWPNVPSAVPSAPHENRLYLQP